ncbi:hypothetical protein HN011_004304 [Eciton burchellii]|nr:hypothetical protein HN011_004304 [Eciton burchellii]
MASVTIHFAVHKDGQTDEETNYNIFMGLVGSKGLRSVAAVDSITADNIIAVESNIPSYIIQEKIESTGCVAMFRGYEEEVTALSTLGGRSGYSIKKSIRGLVRFIEIPDGCVIDGIVNGLSPGEHGMHIHEYGDISNGCNSVGEHFNPNNSLHGDPEDDLSKRHAGDLGNISADATGKAIFWKLYKFLKISDIIGRSLVITENPDDLGKSDNPESKINGNSGTGLTCGIIARSTRSFEKSDEEDLCSR